ncbi:MAG: hypothetical protein ABI134_18750 [Byssovorax sp.]
MHTPSLTALLLACVFVGCGGADSIGETSSSSSSSSRPPRGSSDFARLELDIGFEKSCGECHSKSSNQGQLSFADLEPDAMRAALVGQPSLMLPSMDLVKPGDAESSFMVRKLRGDLSGLGCMQSCGSKMPLGNYPYAEGDRLDFEQWVNDGAK